MGSSVINLEHALQQTYKILPDNEGKAGTLTTQYAVYLTIP